MKLETITTAISEWNKRNDYLNDVLGLLGQGSMFKIPKDVKYTDKGPGGLLPVPNMIHVYPGIIDGILQLFMINSAMDNKQTFDHYGENVTQFIYSESLFYLDSTLLDDFMKAKSYSFTELIRNPSSGGNDNGDKNFSGRDRIIQWSMCCQGWVKEQINNVYGMFRAYAVPIIDIKGPYIYAFFALRKNDQISAENGHLENPRIADLILWNRNEGQNHFLTSGLESDEDEFEDTVRPVPPFGDGVTNESNFYMLS